MRSFLYSSIAEYPKTEVSGKRVGYGVGDWCSLAAQYGAKSIDGFDIQPEWWNWLNKLLHT